MRLRPNSDMLGRLSFRSSFGPAYILLVWLLPFTLHVAVERVDGQMWMTVSWNWLEGLRLDFLVVTGSTLGDVPTGWSTAKENCSCFRGRPSFTGTTASTRNHFFSSGHKRSFSTAGLCLKPGLYFSSLAMLLMLAFFVVEMDGL